MMPVELLEAKNLLFLSGRRDERKQRQQLRLSMAQFQLLGMIECTFTVHRKASFHLAGDLQRSIVAETSHSRNRRNGKDGRRMRVLGTQALQLVLGARGLQTTGSSSSSLRRPTSVGETTALPMLSSLRFS